MAREHATLGIEHCRRLSYAPPLVDGLLTLARIRHAEGDPLAAAAAIDEAEDVMPQAVELRDRIRAIGVRLGLADGHVAEAARWVRAHGLTTDGEPAYPREQEYLVLVRVLLAEHHAEQALEMLGRWHTLARAQGRLGSVITMRVLAALAHAASGDEPAASAALAEALTLAAPEGYIRVFVDEGAPLAALLRTLLLGRRLEQLAGADAVPREFLRRLASSFDRHGMSVLPTARRGAVAVPGNHRAAERPGAGGAGVAGHRPPEPHDRRRAGDHRGHREAARQPRLREAGCREPNPSRRPGTTARAAALRSALDDVDGETPA